MLAYFLLTSMMMASSTAENENLCFLKDRAFPETVFKKVTCASCYSYMHSSNFHPGKKALRVADTYLLAGNLTVEANVTCTDKELLNTFLSQSTIEKWKQCCFKAEECCIEMIEASNTTNGSDWCPWTWDGWLCWPQTPPDSTKQRPCPAYIRFGTEHHCELMVKKSCRNDGHWYGHPANQSIQWTDYTSCSIHNIMELRLYVGVIAYVVSAVFLLPALIIFHIYRQLHGHRISLHKNLFISLLLNAIFEIWFKTGVLLKAYNDNSNGDESTLKQNTSFCKLLLILTKYFRLTNYMWMFCEGFYLHHLIVATFAEERSLRLFYIIGWVFPIVPVIIYSILRVYYSDEHCWALPVEPSEWVLNVPSLLSLVVNIVFLVDIIRILVIKLRAPHHQESTQYRKAVKATLVLVPLFGLHYVITVYRPPAGSCLWPELYVYLDILLDGLQGATVALIFCYINGEVHAVIQRSYHNFLELRNPSLSTGQCLGCSTIATTQTAF